MPTYEYECSKCRRTFEVEQKISDPPLAHCALNIDGETFAVRGGVWCGGDAKRLIAGHTGFVLAGKGWFRDGY
jgi:predicted nucleic acid-binding Zn ribbon protein